MKRLAIIAAVLLALVVTLSAVYEAVGEVAAESRTPAPVPVAARRTAVVGALVEAQRTVTGTASWMPAKYGPSYLAMRLPRGTQVTICAATCWDAVVNDYGPSKRIHPDRIADIAVGRWEQITGLDRSAGVARVTVAVGLAVAARPTLPATSTEETP